MLNRNSVVLIVLDGWGYRASSEHNAIESAKTPQWDQWWQTCPHLLLNASEEAVGLPKGQMGNSEVGHMHIGAGRLVDQEFTAINKAIQNGDFMKNRVLLSLIDRMKRDDKAIHVMGLFSAGGVHSHQEHLFAFMALCAQQDFSKLYLHLFTDGRDTAPQQIRDSLNILEQHLSQCPGAKIASITGRYSAMDRDHRWSRIEPVYQMLTEGQAEFHFDTPDQAVTYFYAQGINDEFFPPTLIGDTAASVESGDSIFFFNFRADRAKQLTQAFIGTNFQDFKRHKIPELASFVSMTSFDPQLPTLCVFPSRPLSDTLGEVLAKHGLHQLRIAETEKFAHVTYFFNGAIHERFAGEDRILIPSPKVATYDLKPQMSAPELTEAMVQAIQSQRYDFILCNFANADMVGHSGNFTATVAAIEAIDKALYAIGQAVKEVQGQLLITADHGNAESMFDSSTQQSHTAHTCEPVPLLYIGDPLRRFREGPASLCDIAPTILTLFQIPRPALMTGESLWEAP